MAITIIRAHEYKLTTAEILYHLPDYPALLQSFIWQQLDQAPEFPQLKKFLDFWHKNIEGKLHSVTIAHAELITPHEINFAKDQFLLH